MGKMAWIPRIPGGPSAGQHICNEILDMRADYACVGFVGRKGKKDTNLLGSNVLEIISRAQCSAVIIKDDSRALLPVRRPTKFVVSVSLNKASTKAFLDALRWSKPNDSIHVVYIKSFMENVDSDYTKALREKYAGFFDALGDESNSVFQGFHDREIVFQMVDKQRRESTAQAVVRYAEEEDADFVVVGTNNMRTLRGKYPVGSVSMQICMEVERNLIIANWIDLKPEVYDRH